VAMTINLLGRDLNWLEYYQAPAGHETIYPVHFRAKLAKLLAQRG
jgi:hypothetical protein